MRCRSSRSSSCSTRAATAAPPRARPAGRRARHCRRARSAERLRGGRGKDELAAPTRHGCRRARGRRCRARASPPAPRSRRSSPSSLWSAPAHVVLALATVACLAASVVVVANDHRNTTQVRRIILPGNPSWIDASGIDDVAFLQTPLGNRGFATSSSSGTARSRTPLVLPETTPVDAFSGSSRSRATGHSDRSQPIERPLAVEAYGTARSGSTAPRRSPAQRYTAWSCRRTEAAPRALHARPPLGRLARRAARSDWRREPGPGRLADVRAERAGRSRRRPSLLRCAGVLSRRAPSASSARRVLDEWRVPYAASFTGPSATAWSACRRASPSRADPMACSPHSQRD